MASTSSSVATWLKTLSTEVNDSRILTTEELRALAWFFLYGQNVFSQYGMDWRGASFRQREERCNLAVKAGEEGIPLVAFVTAQNPISCVRIFVRQWHEGTVKWYADRYK